MTGEEMGETQSQDDRIQRIMKRVGANDIDDLEIRIDELGIRNRSFARLRNERDQLREKLDDIEQAKRDAAMGVDETTDPAIRRLARSVDEIRRDLRKTRQRVIITPEDREMEAEFEEAFRRYPFLAKIEDDEERMEAARPLARSIRAEKTGGASSDSEQSPSRAHYLERSGPITSAKAAADEEKDLEAYSKELDMAGPSEAKREAVSEKFRRKYPRWGI